MATITQSIGSANGRDFPTVAAWFATIPSDVVASGNSYVGEMYKDSEFIVSSTTSIGGKTCDATHTITLKAAAGQSFKDNANVLTNALRYNAANGVGISGFVQYGNIFDVSQDWFRMTGLQIRNTGRVAIAYAANMPNTIIEDNILENKTVNLLKGAITRNNLFINTATSGDGIQFEYASGGAFDNNTVVRPSGNASGRALYVHASTVTGKNNALFGFASGIDVSGGSFTGSNNASDGLIPFGTGNLENLAYASQFENVTSGAADFRLKAGSALINAGTTGSSTTSIGGATRPQGGTYDIGAWEAAVAATVPNAPTNVSATAGNGTASVSFTAPANDGGSAITGYTATASTGETASGTSSPIAFTGLANATARTFTVKATNAIGQSAASAPSNSVIFTPPAQGSTVPSAPTNVIATAGDGAVSVAFSTPANGGDPITGYTVTASTGQTATGTASPISVTVPNGTQASFTVVATNGNGASQPSIPSNTVTPSAAGDSDVQQGSITVRTRGIGPGKTFANLNAFRDYIAGIDCVATNQMIIGEVYTNQTFLNTLACANSDASRFVWIRPAATLGFSNFYTASTAENYGSQGIEITCQEINYDTPAIGYGVRLSGFRIKLLPGAHGGGALLMKQTAGTFPPELVRNRILANSADGLAMTAYGTSSITDNLFVRDAAVGGRLIANQWMGQPVERNTFVLLAGGTASAAIYNEYGGTYNNNVFAGFVQPFTHISGGRDNNYTNQTPTLAMSGLIADTVNPFFVNAATDFRPASALIGKGNASSVSINDNIGSNRGLSPDVGAFQLTPASTLPLGTVAVQKMDGATLVLSGTTSNNPVAGKISLSADTPANGAVPVGPLDLILGTGTFGIEIDDLQPGSYTITATLTNAGGTTLVIGASAFDVMGMENVLYDTGGVGQNTPGTPPPTITITSTDATIMSGKRATLSGAVNLQGDTGGHVDVFLDPQPTGTPQLVAGTTSVNANTWTKQFDVPPGLWKLRAAAAANSQTATASTGDIRVLNLTGNFTLPTA